MNLREPLLAELRVEAATTRSLLERMPEASSAWRPHPRSRSLGELAAHLAGLPALFLATLDRDAHDRTEEGSATGGVAEALERFDSGVARAAEVLGALSDERLLAPFRYLVRGRLVFELPRLVVARSAALNHMIHHRGQLAVYLRLLDVALPPIYGPTADSEGLDASLPARNERSGAEA